MNLQFIEYNVPHLIYRLLMETNLKKKKKKKKVIIIEPNEIYIIISENQTTTYTPTQQQQQQKWYIELKCKSSFDHGENA